jgi:hypothetical protein
MAFMADKVSSARSRQKQARISEAGKAGARVLDIVEFGDLDQAAGAAVGSSLTAMFGGRMRVDGVMVLRLETNGWPHAFARETLRHSDYPWDPAAGPDVAAHLKLAPALRQVVRAIAWEWAPGWPRSPSTGRSSYAASATGARTWSCSRAATAG